MSVAADVQVRRRLSPALERPSHLPRRVRVAFSTTAITSFVSVWKAASLAVAELNIAALFLVGALAVQVGPLAPWFVVVAWALSMLARTIDIESWALFIPGGTTGRVEVAFGDRAARIAAAATLAERLLLCALCSLLIGHYIAAFLVRSATTAGPAALQDVAPRLGGGGPRGVLVFAPLPRQPRPRAPSPGRRGAPCHPSLPTSPCPLTP